ncbi:MAG TPA: hypothetical protein QGF58_02815 [Myxococcota bacterium]|nr:hypothetical protein [Myxococcota bacterium]
MRPRDTSEEAWAVQVALLRRAGPSERLRLTLQMCDDARQLTRDGIVHRHPEWTEEQIRQELARLVLGDELASRVAP